MLCSAPQIATVQHGRDEDEHAPVLVGELGGRRAGAAVLAGLEGALVDVLFAAPAGVARDAAAGEGVGDGVEVGARRVVLAGRVNNALLQPRGRRASAERGERGGRQPAG